MKVLVLLAALVACVAGVPYILQKPLPDGRIVGGTTTTITNFPYQLSLRYSGSHICGASIISANWAVTAGHCIIGSASSLTLRAGSTYSNTGGTVHQVSQAIRHGSYNANTLDYDIAVLKVSSAFSFGSSVQAIPLETGSVSAGTSAVVSGWGTTSEGGSASTTLRQVAVPIVSDSSCNSAYSSYGGITARMICAGYTSGGKDACQGDSGGPLVANGKLIGIVSWGAGCARPNYPGVYTKVSALRSWISSNTGV
ncbi:trypsin beta-like [Periplaneta americana]|uniref:trypsin beta-like n=1 Tax=Periplaneta americana TaxID=6978 RepID=UPI0037E7D8C8